MPARTMLRLGLSRLPVLTALQPIFGVEAWIRRFGTWHVAGSCAVELRARPRANGHHVLGTLIFASAVALAVLLHRPARESVVNPVPFAHNAPQLEGVA